MGILSSTPPKRKILRLYACLALKPVGQALPRCSGKQICCYRRSAFKVNPRTTAPSLQSHSGQQPSQRPDLRGTGTYEHGVVPLPVLFTFEALTMQVTRYSKQDQADHGKSRWPNLGNELGHFLLHPYPRRCIWESRQAYRLYSPALASSGTFPPHHPVLFVFHEKVMNF